jgi:hypothetical protein
MVVQGEWDNQSMFKRQNEELNDPADSQAVRAQEAENEKKR